MKKGKIIMEKEKNMQIITTTKLNDSMEIRLVKWKQFNGHYIETKEDDDPWAMLVDTDGDSTCNLPPESKFITPKQWFENVIEIVKEW